MASSEAITLLSFYNDEEDVEDVEEDLVAAGEQQGDDASCGTANCSSQSFNPEHSGDVQEEENFVGPSDKSLHATSKAKCSEELQMKINKLLHHKKAGKSFATEVRNRKDYRNPYFLPNAVRHWGLDETGSCFSKDESDPSDFYDVIEADMRRERDRKEQEKKKAQMVGFISGGTQAVTVVGVASRNNLPISASSAVTVTGDAINGDGRQNKKSKWDEVGGDWKNPLPSIGKDSVSNVGAGYMRYAQEKWREAEGKRSRKRKLESRSWYSLK